MPRLQEDAAQIPESFHFVNGNPSSETERSLTRLLVRSHVGKWTWQQQLKTRPSDNEGARPGRRAQSERRPVKRKISIKEKTESNTELLDNAIPISSSKTSSQENQEPVTAANFESEDDKKQTVSGLQPESPEASSLSPSILSLKNITIGTLNPSGANISSIPSALINICNEYS